MAKGSSSRIATSKKVGAITKKVAKPKKTVVKRAKKTSTKKVAKVKAVHKKKTAKKLSTNKLTASSSKTATEKKVLVPSPYRFPLDIHSLMIKTARYGGVFFVALGALFTLHYTDLVLSTSSEHYTYTANVIDSTTQSATDCTTGTLCTTVKETLGTPKALISASSPLRESVAIGLSVANAKEVKVLAYNTATKREQSLGRMNPASGSEWKYEWNTKEFDDGNYILTFFIKNDTQAIEYSDKKTYKVENNPLAISEEKEVTEQKEEEQVEQSTAILDETIEEIATTVEQVAPKVSDVSLKTEKSGPYDDSIKFLISVPDAKRVKVYQLNAQQTGEKLLGYATLRSDGSWLYVWNTEEVVNGEYILIAQALYESSNTQSNKLSVVIQHKVESVELDDNEVSIEKVQNPDVDIEIAEDDPLANTTEILISTPNATFVEVYAMNRQSAIRTYLGLAQKLDANMWRYLWNTKNLPNGTYTIALKVKNQFGIFERLSDQVTVKNTVLNSPTSEQTEKITMLSKIAEEEKEVQLLKEQQQEENEDEEATSEAQSDTQMQNQDVVYEATFQTYTNDIDQALARLAVALRTEDADAVSKIKGEITQIKTRMQDTEESTSDGYATYVDKRLSDAVAKTENDVRRTSQIVTDRTKEVASKDSDNDGVADFDEIYLFNTDPYSADSDNDGYIDGVEILRGYDPTNSAPEAVVVFESPKETGVVREDILAVETITASTPVAPGVNQVPQAVISGKGLPNSYVTLYIFSTPIVVTVKTDDDGSWYYKFDKELEDGQHEVYVGITDNAGKIVAKSNPLTFIKRAEAFNEVDDTAPVISSVASNDSNSSFMSAYMMYLILSISVVSIGLVLILLGFFLSNRDKLALQIPEPSTL